LHAVHSASCHVWEYSYKEAQTLVEELKSKIPVSCIPIDELPPAIIVHAGPKVMGVGFF
jgi:fatty acid-binding protein DegV